MINRGIASNKEPNDEGAAGRQELRPEPGFGELLALHEGVIWDRPCS